VTDKKEPEAEKIDDYVEYDKDDFAGVSNAYKNAANETDVPRYADEDEKKEYKDRSEMVAEVVGGEGFVGYGAHQEKNTTDSTSKTPETESKAPVQAPKAPESVKATHTSTTNK